MSPDHPKASSKLAGRGLMGGILLFATSAWVACQPGDLDCCQAFDGGFGGAGGAGTNTGGRSGTGGAPATGGGSGGTVTPMPTTAIPNCTKYPTLAKMDEFFAMRCGMPAGCHESQASAWSDLKAPNVWMRMLDADPKFSCKTGGKMINKGAPANSLILSKTKMVMCPPGSSDGISSTTMPPMGTMGQPVLTAEEAKCLTNFVHLAAGTTPPP